MMAVMRAIFRNCRQSFAVRVLALLLALGVAASPLLPRPQQHVCRMAGTASLAMAGDCCCVAVFADPDHRAPDHRAPDKGSCCQELAFDQHQPTALTGPESAGPRTLPTAELVEVLPHSACHDRRFSAAACAAPYPAGPPAYLRWGGFLT